MDLAENKSMFLRKNDADFMGGCTEVFRMHLIRT
jgi:hypothetical protein